MKPKRKSILFITQYSHQIGYGHLRRSQIIYTIVKNHFLTTLIPYSFTSINNELLHMIKNNKFTFINLDFRYYDDNIVLELSKYANLILWDSLKTYPTHHRSIYFNPTTPIQYNHLYANQFVYEGLEFLPLNKNLTPRFNKSSKANKNVFIAFGNSDPNQLSLKILKHLKHIHFNHKTTLNIGPHFNQNYVPKLKTYLQNNFQSYQITECPKSIIPFLQQNNFIISSYGISALEGLLLSKKVALFNNSPYHTFLSKYQNNMFYLGTYPYTFSWIIKKRLKTFFSNYSNAFKINDLRNNKKIKNAINEFPSLKKIIACPVCKHKNVKLIFNQTHKQLHHCLNCQSKFLHLQEAKSTDQIYTQNYFVDEYKQHYGQTYVDDKKNILQLAENRLTLLKKLMRDQTNNKKILDIGCAYGFFLLKAKEFGFIPTGIEIEKAAANYAKHNLHLNVLQGDFLHTVFHQKFDVITLWYVFEHFAQPEKIMQKVVSLLGEDGYLCLSLPNGNGPFYHFNQKGWLEQHPDDHYFDYSSKGLKIFMKRFGLHLLKTKIAGFHPERYKNFPKILQPILQWMKKGDTIELYFKKTCKGNS